MAIRHFHFFSFFSPINLDLSPSLFASQFSLSLSPSIPRVLFSLLFLSLFFFLHFLSLFTLDRPPWKSTPVSPSNQTPWPALFLTNRSPELELATVRHLVTPNLEPAKVHASFKAFSAGSLPQAAVGCHCWRVGVFGAEIFKDQQVSSRCSAPEWWREKMVMGMKYQVSRLDFFYKKKTKQNKTTIPRLAALELL